MPAAGRNQVAYDDIGYDGLTQFIDGVTITYTGPPSGVAVRGSAQVGLAATWSQTVDDTCTLTQDGDAVMGRIQEVFDDGFCTIAFRGFQQLPAGQSAAITRGRRLVGALGPASARGYIRQVVSAGASYAQAEAVEMGRSRGRIWTIANASGLVWVLIDD